MADIDVQQTPLAPEASPRSRQEASRNRPRCKRDSSLRGGVAPLVQDHQAREILERTCGYFDAFAQHFHLESEEDRRQMLCYLQRLPADGSFEIRIGPAMDGDTHVYRRTYFAWVQVLADEMGASIPEARRDIDAYCVPERDDGVRSTKNLSPKAWKAVLARCQELAASMGIDLPQRG